MKLVMAMPTRNRPEQLIETIVRSIACLSLPNSVLMVQVDDDDKDTINALSYSSFDPRVQIDIRSREDTIAGKWNRALNIPADVYIAGCDDVPLTHPDTDAILLDKAQNFPDGIGMLYGHMANASFPSLGAMTAGFVERLGHIYPEHFSYWFVDHWTDDLARMIGRIQFVNLATDQTRPGKTMELREPAWWATWFDAAYMMRRAIAIQIIEDAGFKSPAWLKRQLIDGTPLIEHRSRWLNSIVRQQAATIGGLSTNDARYQRVKQKAIAMIPSLLDDYGMHPAEAKMFEDVLLPEKEVAA